MKGWDALMVTTQQKKSKQEFLRAISSHTKNQGLQPPSTQNVSN